MGENITEEYNFRPDLNEELSRCLVANGFDRVSYKPVSTWMVNHYTNYNKKDFRLMVITNLA